MLYYSNSASAWTHKILIKTPTILRWAVVRLVDGVAEALVASAPPDHVRPWAMEGHLGLAVILLGLRHGSLEALQGAGLPEAQGRAQRSITWRPWETKETRESGSEDVGGWKTED